MRSSAIHQESTAEAAFVTALRRRERALERGEVVAAVRERGVELGGKWRAIDERREVGRDRRRELVRVAEVRGDVGEVLDDVRVVALPQERAGHPIAIARERVDQRAALGDDASQACEAAALVGAVAGMVPAHEVEELVACRETHLPQALVRLDPRGEPDLVAVGPEAAAAPRVVAVERAARAERPHLGREPLEGALDEPWPGRDIQIGTTQPEALAQAGEIARREDTLR